MNIYLLAKGYNILRLSSVQLILVVCFPPMNLVLFRLYVYIYMYVRLWGRSRAVRN